MYLYKNEQQDVSVFHKELLYVLFMMLFYLSIETVILFMM